MTLRFFLFLFLFPVLSPTAQETTAPFYKEVMEFVQQDSVRTPEKNAILFIGSSSFRLWSTLQEDFPSRKIINRSFGGSTLADQIRYVKLVVYPYSPKQVLIYCGENDFASSDTITAKTVFERFKQLFNLIRARYPAVPIAFVSMKPSPSRQLLLGKVQEGNAMIRKFLKTKKKTVYIDVYSEMVDDEGKPRPELFVQDNLHMNRQGYLIWQRLIEPHLQK